MHNFTASPPNKIGYFSPQTSSTNFCELDYEITPYIAEFINSLSNIAYVYLSVTSLPKSSAWYNVLTWPVANLALCSVGIGSFVYHATLKHETELLDELSMYAIIAALNYGVYIHRSFTSTLTRASMGTALLVPITAVSYANFTSSTGASMLVHLTLFVSYVAAFWIQTYRLVYSAKPRPVVQQKQSSISRRADNTDSASAYAHEDATRHHHHSRFRAATLWFLLGFTLWIIDGLCCEQLRAIRAKIGLPFAWLLELHGHWHVWTAVSAAEFVLLVADLACSA